MKTNEEKIITNEKEFVDGTKKGAIEKALKNPIAKGLELSQGEVDIRNLSKKDKDQLAFRRGQNTNAYLKFMNESLNNIELCLLAIVEKLYGEEAEVVLENLVDKKMGKTTKEEAKN